MGAKGLGDEEADVSTSPRAVTVLPVGTYRLHEDVSINFQLHRWIAWTGGDALPDIRRIAPRLTDYLTDRRLFLELAEAALAAGDLRRAAFHVRAAEFFVRGDDPDKQALRSRFVELLLRSRGMTDADRDRIPFDDGWLPAYRFRTEKTAKGTVVVFGGFDSYIEELFAIPTASSPPAGTSSPSRGRGRAARWRRPGCRSWWSGSGRSPPSWTTTGSTR